MTMFLIQTETLTGSASAIEFANIPQNMTDLFILVSTRNATDNQGNGSRVLIRPNGSTLTMEQEELQATGSARSNIRSDVSITGSYQSTNDYTTSTFGNGTIYIPNYSNTARPKIMNMESVSENNATNALSGFAAATWNSTAAITSLTFVCAAGSFAANSSISVYGIEAGSDGIVTVS